MRKGSQVERRGGRRQERRAKGWAYWHLLPSADTLALWDFTLGLQRRESWNLALPETRPEPKFAFSAKRRWSISNPQLRLRPFDQIPASGTRRLEKRGRWGRVKERKKRRKGRGVNGVSCSLPIGALWPVVHIRRRPGLKGPSYGHWVLFIGGQAGPWVPRVVRMSVTARETPLPELPFVAGR